MSDIIKMAQEAGMHVSNQPNHVLMVASHDELEAFAALIRADMKERCAKIADENGDDESYGHAKFRCKQIAAAIRALKGEKE